MSLLSKVWKSVRKVAAPVIGAAIGGPVGGLIGGALAGSSASASAFAAPPPVIPGAGITTAMSALPQLPRLAGVAGAAAGVAGVAVRGARTIAASASHYCRKYPTWCASIGGLAAVEALVGNGQLPPIKRRRRRGITPRDLQSFRRVAGLIKTYGPTARKVPSRCAPRRKC